MQSTDGDRMLFEEQPNNAISKLRAEGIIESINRRVGRRVLSSFHTMGEASFLQIVRSGIPDRSGPELERLLDRSIREPLIEDNELAHLIFGHDAQPTLVVERRRGLVSRLALQLHDMPDAEEDRISYDDYLIEPARLYESIAKINNMLAENGSNVCIPSDYSEDTVAYLIDAFERYESTSPRLDRQERKSRFLMWLSEKRERDVAQTLGVTPATLRLLIVRYMKKIVQIIHSDELTKEAAEDFDIPIDLIHHDEIIENINNTATVPILLPTRELSYEYFNAILKHPADIDPSQYAKFEELKLYLQGTTNVAISQREEATSSDTGVASRREGYITKVVQLYEKDIERRMENPTPLKYMLPSLTQEVCVGLQLISKKSWAKTCAEELRAYTGKADDRRAYGMVIKLLTLFGQTSTFEDIKDKDEQRINRADAERLCRLIALNIVKLKRGDSLTRAIYELVGKSTRTSVKLSTMGDV